MSFRKHIDTRATRFCDLFPTKGDVNLFIINPGQRTCWHRHQRQTDYFRVISGKMRFGRVDEQGNHTYSIFDRPDWRFRVTPNQWHGYENIGTGQAWLLMYLSQKYDPTDEEFMTEAAIPWVLG